MMRLADLHRSEAELERALNYVNTAIARYPESDFLVWMLFQRGLLHYHTEKYADARLAFCDSLELSGANSCAVDSVRTTDFGESYWPASSANFIGLIHHTQGDLSQANNWYGAALDMLPARASAKRVQLLNNIGGIQFMRGDYQSALTEFEKALTLAQDEGHFHEATMALGNMASVNLAIGEHDQAMVQFLSTLDLERKEGLIEDQIHTLHRIGSLYLDLGELATAEDYLQRSLLMRTSHGLPGGGTTLIKLGQLRRKQNKPEEALVHHRDAYQRFLSTSRTHEQFEALIEQGFDYVELKERAEAEAVIEKSYNSYSQVGDKRLQGRFFSLIGAYELLSHNDVAALSAYMEALALHRESLDQVGEIQSHLQISQIYEDNGNLIPALSAIEEAESGIEDSRLSVSDPMLRATYTGELMEVYTAKIRILIKLDRDSEALEVALKSRTRTLLEAVTEPSISSAHPLRRESAELNRELAAKAEALRFIRSEWPESPEIQNLQQEIDELITRLSAFEARLLTGKIGVKTNISASSVQRSLKDGDLLVLHWIGSHQSWRWHVTNSNVAVTTLPPQTKLADTIGTARREIQRANRYAPEQLREIGQLLLGDEIENAKRIFVAPDGVTALVPYNALPSVDGSPISAARAITVVPGGNLLRRELDSQAEKRALIVADPVYGGSDSRLNSDKPSQYPRLTHSALEAAAVADTMESNGYEVERLDGFKANKDIFSRSGYSGAAVIHFATHGVVDSSHPQTSGLMLSMFSEGGQRQSGTLTLSEIYDLDLNAELVVLSACDTAIGRDVAGEGPISLARGFLVGGARQVVASLWPVNDIATKELMKVFYMEWTKGSSASDALRLAQQALNDTRRWNSARYWGAFILVGT